MVKYLFSAVLLSSSMASHGAELKTENPVKIMSNATIVKRVSHADFDSTIAKIKAAVAAKKLTLFATIDHSAKAEAAGLPLPKTQVLMFGSPVVGTPLMAAHPDLALDLPFRVLVAAQADGSTLVSYHPSSLLAVYGIDTAAQQKLAGLERLVDASIGH